MELSGQQHFFTLMLFARLFPTYNVCYRLHITQTHMQAFVKFGPFQALLILKVDVGHILSSKHQLQL